MYVCMCVCAVCTVCTVCIYVSNYVCIYVCVYVCVYVLYILYVCMYICMYVCRYVFLIHINTQSTKRKTGLSKVKISKKVKTNEVLMKAPLHNNMASQGAGPESADFSKLVSR